MAQQQIDPFAQAEEEKARREKFIPKTEPQPGFLQALLGLMDPGVEKSQSLAGKGREGFNVWTNPEFQKFRDDQVMSGAGGPEPPFASGGTSLQENPNASDGISAALPQADGQMKMAAAQPSLMDIIQGLGALFGQGRGPTQVPGAAAFNRG